MSANKNERVAKAIVAMNLIEKTTIGFTVNRPAFRGQTVEGFHVADGKCDCFNFADTKECAHVLAAEMFARDEAALPVEKCFWCLDETIENESGEPVYCAFCGRKSEADFINWQTFETGDDYFSEPLAPKRKVGLCKSEACNEYGTPAVKDELCIDCYEQAKSDYFHTVGEIERHYQDII